MSDYMVFKPCKSYIQVQYGLGIRHLQTLMYFFAIALGNGVRNNISMAIVAMTDTTLENSFDWSMQVQSVILSSYFWGYIILQIPAGELSVKFGGKPLVLIALTTNAVISFFTPVGARYGGWQLVCACRVILGLSQGLITPAIYTLIGKWAPLEEKSFHLSAIGSGNQIGTAIQILTTGFIAAAWGWPMIFYVNGITASIFVLTYLVVGADSPRSSRFISDQERLFIEKSLGQRETPKKLKTPWKAIWTSIPFLTLIVSHCAHNWGYWTLMNGTPSYMKLVHNVDTKANGVMSALPYLAAYIMTFVFGYFSDYFINKKILKLSAARKLSNSIALYAPAIALVALCYVSPGDTTMGVALITVTVGLNVGRVTGFLIVHLDMSSNFAGTLIGITNMFASIMSIVTPLATGLILKDETNIMEWRIVFYITAAIFFIGNTQFLIFGTSARQPWDKPVKENATDAKLEKQMENTVYNI